MVDYSILSKAGSRNINEDSAMALEGDSGQLFIVADGLGGHGFGDKASQLTVHTFARMYAAEKTGIAEAFLPPMFEEAQKQLLMLQTEMRCRDSMKSTASVAAVTPGHIVTAHIGDSRIYLFSRWRVLFRTLDHSVPQLLVQMGKIREKDIRHHPDRNRLVHALGVESDELHYEIHPYPHAEKVRGMLLCSDGFWEYIDERHMLSTLRTSSSSQEWLEKMEKIVLENAKDAKMDNYSAITVIMNRNDRSKA